MSQDEEGFCGVREAQGAYSEPDHDKLDAELLKEEGNQLLKADEPELAIERYEGALEVLGNSSSYVRERATLLGNLSAAQLARGSPERALEAARSASGMDTAYTKAYFREAKALLALGRPCAAVSAARRLYFVAGMDRADREVRNLLDAAAEQLRKRQHRPRVSCRESSSAPASDLESTVDLPDLVADCCNGEELVQLSQTSRRLRKQLFSEEALLCRASQLCHSRSWLRRDAAFGQSAGWAYAIHLAHARSSIRDRLAVCRTDGKVALVDPETGDQQLLPVPGHGVDFTLCWGPRSEFLAFTAVNKASGAALIVIPTLQRSQPLVIPLIPFLTPYYLSPSPCGTRIALLGSVRGQQALLVADVAQLLVSCRGEAPVARLCCLGTAAPLYFDWAPHGPELVLACNENKLARIRADVLNEVEDSVQTLPCCEPAEAQVKSLDSLPGTVIQGRISFRAPQWLPWPDAAEGRWLVPTDAPQTGRVSLALVDPATGRSDTVCESLAPEAHFTATPSGWVAWCGLHDNRGHGGVFARRVLPSMGPPISVFAHANRVEGMSWGGDRLALLIHAPNCLVWAVWDPVEAAKTGNGLYVAPQGFIPGRSFSGRVLPFFDQFERRVDYWNPGHDALVYADFNAEVWVQPFPRPPEPHAQEEVHPLQSLAGAQQLCLAPPRRRIAAGSYACWSPS